MANELTNTNNLLTHADFLALADVPDEVTWFANIDNRHTRRAYQNDIKMFMSFIGIQTPQEFRIVTRAHVIAWRKHLESQALSGASIRRKLAALSSLFEYLCESNAVVTNPVKGTKRPRVDNNEGKTAALGDHEARALLAAPDKSTIKGLRDYAILSVFLYHGLRREELVKLRICDLENRRGITHLRIQGKGSKIRYVPLHPDSAAAIDEYLSLSTHHDNKNSPVFKSVKGEGGLDVQGIYYLVAQYLDQCKITSCSPHSLRATAATNALDNNADIAKVQEWLGHSNIATTRLYDRRTTRPADSPTFKVIY